MADDVEPYRTMIIDLELRNSSSAYVIRVDLPGVYEVMCYEKPNMIRDLSNNDAEGLAYVDAVMEGEEIDVLVTRKSVSFTGFQIDDVHQQRIRLSAYNAYVLLRFLRTQQQLSKYDGVTRLNRAISASIRRFLYLYQ